MSRLLVIVIFFLSLIYCRESEAISSYLVVQQNYAFVMSGSEPDNGGSAANIGAIAGIMLGSFGLEGFYKGYTFLNKDIEVDGTGIYDTTMEDSAFGFNLRYKYTKYFDFFIGYTNHTIKAEYDLESFNPAYVSGLQISMINGSYWGFSFGAGLDMPIWRKFSIYTTVGAYKVNSPISFFNADIGLKYLFGGGSSVY